MVYHFFPFKNNAITKDSLESTQAKTTTIPSSSTSSTIPTSPFNKNLVSVQQEDLKLKKHQFLSSSDNLVVGL